MTEECGSFYGDFAPYLERVRDVCLNELEGILGSITDDPENTPFEHLSSRIKEADSARYKLRARNAAEDGYSALNNLSDIIGIRIITHFVGEIYYILEKINGCGKWKVDRIKDYIASPKPNGYRSLHVILKVPFGCGDLSHIYVEVQIRTIAMDCWAALEHQMRYKKGIKNTGLLQRELKRCADEMASADLTMQTIKDVLCQTDSHEEILTDEDFICRG